jgi:predicted RNase H-like nuclease (RuvC/YqgF family)
LTNEIRLLEQTIQKLEKQLTTLHAHNQSLEQNEQSYQDKINECETLLISMKEVNKNSLYQLEQKKLELNAVQTEIQTLKYEQSSTVSKVIKEFCFGREKSFDLVGKIRRSQSGI